jgi:hypothetical protein
LENALLPVHSQPRLQVLPSGPVPSNPSELLSSRRTHELFGRLRTYADVVIVDSAPILPVTDASVLSTHADAVLIVVSAGVDRRRDAVRSVQMLKQINAPMAGTVLNRAPDTDSYAYYRYGYGYGYEVNPHKLEKKNGKSDILSPVKDDPNVEGGTDSEEGSLGSGAESVAWPPLSRHINVEDLPATSPQDRLPNEPEDTMNA